MEQSTDVHRAAAMLAEEIAQTHNAFMGMYHFVCDGTDPMVQLHFMKAASRMMQAQASAVLSLQRLTNGGAQTYTFVHERRPPTPQISKTNVPSDVTPCGSGATDAETDHGA